MSVTDIPDSLKCGLCSQACKRGVRVPCCNTRACRGCATKHVTRTKVCWNKECGVKTKTGDMVIDQELREDVDKFLSKATAKKEVINNQDNSGDLKSEDDQVHHADSNSDLMNDGDREKSNNINNEKENTIEGCKEDTNDEHTSKERICDNRSLDSKNGFQECNDMDITDENENSGEFGIEGNKDKENTTDITNEEIMNLESKSDKSEPNKEIMNLESKSDKSEPNKEIMNLEYKSDKSEPNKEIMNLESKSDKSEPNEEIMNLESKSDKSELKVKKPDVPVGDMKTECLEIGEFYDTETFSMDVICGEDIDAPGTESMNMGVSLAKMRERNSEFERCMSPVERACKELRFGAQLELMLKFETNRARCLMCGKTLGTEFLIMKHLQLKHKDEYERLRTVLEISNMNTLNMFVHKAIRSEFLFQQKKVFPIPVDY